MNPRLCEECDQPIPQKRLAAVPDARLCVQCAAQHEMPVQAGDRLVMNSLVQHAEYDLEHHLPEPHE
jgi:RNA polymerase-binding transcription factor DksA